MHTIVYATASTRPCYTRALHVPPLRRLQHSLPSRARPTTRPCRASPTPIPQPRPPGAAAATVRAPLLSADVSKTATYTHSYAKSNCFLTWLSDGERLTGAYALGPEAGEWLRQATLSIRPRAAHVLLDTIQPFPTFSEIYLAALKALHSTITESHGSAPASTEARTPRRVSLPAAAVSAATLLGGRHEHHRREHLDRNPGDGDQALQPPTSPGHARSASAPSDAMPRIELTAARARPAQRSGGPAPLTRAPYATATPTLLQRGGFTFTAAAISSSNRCRRRGSPTSRSSALFFYYLQLAVHPHIDWFQLGQVLRCDEPLTFRRPALRRSLPA